MDQHNKGISQDISDIKFNDISFGGGRDGKLTFKCNVNRDVDNELFLLRNFDDAIPYYDVENGPHLKISTSKSSVPEIVRLNSSAASTVRFEGANKLSDEEYYPIFVEKKSEFVKNNLIKNTYSKGFQNPSSVQALTIVELIQRRDALVQFKSGTGKTHAFLFGCLWGFDPEDKSLQYVFVTSTHEVAVQIYNHAMSLLPETSKIALCIGHKKEQNMAGNFKTPIGTSSLNNNRMTIAQERDNVKNAQVIVCTMGKFYDYMSNKGWIRVDGIKAFGVDEFDYIVSSKTKSNKSPNSMTTEEQMAAIFQKISPRAQRVFFSATVSQESLEIAHSYFRPYNPYIGEPFIVLLDIEDYTLEGIKQYYVKCTNLEEKKEILNDLLKQCRISQGIIFTNRIETAEQIKQMLNGTSVPFDSAVFHAGLSEEQRKSIHESFLKNKIRLLISTDVLSRGFDAQGINVVINFDMPKNLEQYIHRVGRSGRYGRQGVAISFVLTNNMQNELLKVDKINDCSKHNEMKELPLDLENLL